MNKQQNLSFLHDELTEMKTHKREFLEKMDAIMPWEHLYELVQPCYYEGAHGNKPCDLERMLIIHLLQNLDDLSIVFLLYHIAKVRSIWYTVKKVTILQLFCAGGV